MVSKSRLVGHCRTVQMGLYMRVTIHLLTGMILQVGKFSREGSLINFILAFLALPSPETIRNRTYEIKVASGMAVFF